MIYNNQSMNSTRTLKVYTHKEGSVILYRYRPVGHHNIVSLCVVYQQVNLDPVIVMEIPEHRIVLANDVFEHTVQTIFDESFVDTNRDESGEDINNHPVFFTHYRGEK